MKATTYLIIRGPGAGPLGKTPPSFQLRLELENLTGEEITVAKPRIEAKDLEFRIDRWFVEKTKGEQWNGVLKAKEKQTIMVIGYPSDSVTPGTKVDVRIEIHGLKIEVSTVIEKGLLVRCPCGCDRSEAMVQDLKKQPSATAIETIRQALKNIEERENLGYVTETMISHRLRLLNLEAELRRER